MISLLRNLYNQTSYVLKYSLAGQTLRQMMLRLSLIIGVSTLIASYHLSTVVKSRMTETLDKYITERSARESIIFEKAKLSHKQMQQRYFEIEQLVDADQSKIQSQFNQILKKDSDGVYRNKDKNFNGLKDVGIYISTDKPLTTEFQKKILTSLKLVEQFGLPMHSIYQDTYMTFAENAMVIYWPESPNWVFKASKELNITDEVYHKIGTLPENPQRQTVWTDTFFDKVGKIWMVTATTPIVDSNNENIGYLHHDVMLNELLNRLVEDHLGSATNFLISDKGQLIAHPDFMKQITEVEGDLKILNLKDDVLSYVWKQINTKNKDKGQFETPGLNGYLVGFDKIEGPNWYYISVYPKSVIWKSAFINAQVVLYSGLFALLVEILLIYVVLLKKVRHPLHLLIKATKQVAKRQYKIDVNSFEKNEIGQLAVAFQSMATPIQQRDQKIENHTHELENLVKIRTDELEKQRLVSLHAAKMSSLGEMAGGVAHEINTPLAVVKLLCERSIDKLNNDTIDVVALKNDLKKIDATTDRMAKIIKSLRIFARDGSYDKLETQSVMVLLEDTIQLCSEKLKTYGVSLSYYVEPSDLTVDCQTVQLSQVILNLITNAFDAIAGLQTQWIKIKAFQDANDVVITVTDSGIGISEKLAEKIFNPFFTTKDIGKGTGMGLSISASIISNHKGTLTINTNSPNTEFVIRIPRFKS